MRLDNTNRHNNMTTDETTFNMLVRSPYVCSNCVNLFQTYNKLNKKLIKISKCSSTLYFSPKLRFPRQKYMKRAKGEENETKSMEDVDGLN